MNTDSGTLGSNGSELLMNIAKLWYDYHHDK